MVYRNGAKWRLDAPKRTQVVDDEQLGRSVLGYGEEVMPGDLEDQLQHLERALGHLRLNAKQAFGFVEKVEYGGVLYDVSRRAVIADLSPLFFSHLIEHIDNDGVAVAVRRLHERLVPLLTCRHRWTLLKRAGDEQVRGMARTAVGEACPPHICKICNAYVLGADLPVLGRELT